MKMIWINRLSNGSNDKLYLIVCMQRNLHRLTPIIVIISGKEIQTRINPGKSPFWRWYGLKSSTLSETDADKDILEEKKESCSRKINSHSNEEKLLTFLFWYHEASSTNLKLKEYEPRTSYWSRVFWFSHITLQEN